MPSSPTPPVKNHSFVAKFFHWGFIAVFVYALTKQLGNVTELEDSALLLFEVVFAVAFLGLLFVRFVYMSLTQPTVLPETTPKLMKVLARLGHLAMYASLAMIAVSGLWIGAIFSFGGANAAGMNLAIGLHETSVMASYILIGVHVAAAVYHRLKGDGIWSAMVPVWKERQD